MHSTERKLPADVSVRGDGNEFVRNTTNVSLEYEGISREYPSISVTDKNIHKRTTMVERQCIGCRQIKDRKELIKITRTADSVVINPASLTFGRSAYLCYNKFCIETALKKNKLGKALKIKISDELKGQLLNELRNNKNK